MQLLPLLLSCVVVWEQVSTLPAELIRSRPSQAEILKEADQIIWERLSHNPYRTEREPNSTYHVRRRQTIPFLKNHLKRLGITQEAIRKLKIIHVAGSKGKGSTSAFIERILRTAGLKTALFTSPHLIHPRERICINGYAMDEMEFAKGVVKLYHDIEAAEAPMPKFFHFLTILALRHMVRLQKAGKLDVVILEVGMGGKYDATNVVNFPSVTAITSLAMEHVRELGPTLQHIAKHKTGIAKRGVQCYSLPQVDEAKEVVISECERIGAPLEFVSTLEEALGVEPHSVDDWILGIKGDHQRMNSAIAIKCCQQWFQLHREEELPIAIIKEALEKTHWPGRHQIYQDKERRVEWYLDGAHTIESLTFVSDWFAPVAKPKILVFHCTHGRSYETLLEPFFGMDLDRVYFAKPALPTDSDEERANPDLAFHEEMADFWREKVGSHAEAIASRDIPSKAANGGDSILVTGSLYLVGDIMRDLGIPFKLG